MRNTQLSPFVTNKIKKEDVKLMNSEFKGGRMTGNDYLAKWKEENGTT